MESWLNNEGIGISGRTLRKTIGGKYLLINNNYTHVRVIGLNPNNEIELDIRLTGYGKLIDFRGCGEKWDTVALLGETGYLRILKFSKISHSVATVDNFKIDLKEDKGEGCYSLSVDKDGEIFLVVIKSVASFGTSRVICLVMENGKLIEKGEVDYYGGEIDRLHCIEFYGYRKDKVIFTALSYSDEESLVFTFAYDFIQESFKEIFGFRRTVNANFCSKLEKVGENMYSCSQNARLVKISYENEE